jgi:uncharacterized surface protein with fasciclin (FAS1) repeats
MKLSRILAGTAVMAFLAAAPVMAETIAEKAVATPDLSTLVTALGAAEMVEALNGPGPFTVFAPSNEAFAALPAGLLDDLLKPENKDKLVDLLQYHVIEGELDSERLKGSTVDLTALNGQMLPNPAETVVTADIRASNGIIHIVNQVLLPRE